MEISFSRKVLSVEFGNNLKEFADAVELFNPKNLALTVFVGEILLSWSSSKGNRNNSFSI